MTAVFEFEALGTHWWVEFLTRKSVPPEISDFILEHVKQFDEDYSRFKPTSYVGLLNQYHHLENPSRELLQMMSFAHKMHAATEGTFNISVGATLQALGYGKGVKSARFDNDFWTKTTYTSEKIEIPSHVSIDFGGFGKGWLLDTLAGNLEKRSVNNFVINGGGDIVVSSAQPIELGLENPYDPKQLIGSIKIANGALAVSGSHKRRWKKGEITHHHIVDPKTNQSSQSGVASVYVQGSTGLIADTVATVLFLRPELQQKLEKQFGVQAVVLRVK